MSVLAVVLASSCGGSSEPDHGTAPTTSSVTTRPDVDAETFDLSVDDRAAQFGAKAGIEVEDIARATVHAALSLLPEQELVSITITIDPTRAIPEVGVGGRTDLPFGDIRIWLDDTPPIPIKDVLQTWLPATLVHELHHASRIHVGPGYGGTLGEALVTEGLADRFVLEVLPDTPTSPWTDALDETELATVWAEASPILWQLGYDHVQWFFGTGSAPRWAGYTIGFDAVGRYLEAEGVLPSELVELRAEEILAGYTP